MDLERYRRQIIVKELNKKGQIEISKKKVAIIGAGGLGSNSANILVRMGIGEIHIADNDVIDITNLHRMSLYDEQDIGKLKSEVIAKKLKKINSRVFIYSYDKKITKNNIKSFVKDADILIDGTDNLMIRYLINDFSIKNELPWIYSGVYNTVGMVMAIIPSYTPCFKCISPTIFDKKEKEIPVLGNLPNIIASIQCTEALKILIGNKPSGLIIYDIWKQIFEVIEINRNPDCKCCCQKSFEYI
jgi:adenylyltransferase/sulfurtransferase